MKNRTSIVALALAISGLAAACSSSYDRAELVDELMADTGITEEQANCIADGMESEIGEDRLNDRGNPTAEEEAIMTDIAIDCMLGS